MTPSIRAFSDELTKIADIVIRDGAEGSPVVAAGIFVGTESGFEQKSKQLQSLLKQHKSLQATKREWLKKNPNDFVTVAIKKEGPPEGLSHGIGKMFGSAAAKSRSKSYEDRVKSPRIFLRVDQTGGHGQSSFYNEVARGLYDDELNQPHISKRDRKVYV